MYYGTVEINRLTSDIMVFDPKEPERFTSINLKEWYSLTQFVHLAKPYGAETLLDNVGSVNFHILLLLLLISGNGTKDSSKVP